MEILKYVKVPLLFVTSTKDKVVNTEDVETLYLAHEGEKEIIYITKDHHELREKGTIDKIVNIGKKYFDGGYGDDRLGDVLRNRRHAHEKQSIKEIMRKRETRL